MFSRHSSFGKIWIGWGIVTVLGLSSFVYVKNGFVQERRDDKIRRAKTRAEIFDQ